MKLPLATGLVVAALLPVTKARIGTSKRTSRNLNERIEWIENKPILPATKTTEPPLSSNKFDDDDEHHRIIGGEVASSDEFPFFVDFGACGGSLVYEDIVVSAAHCVATITDYGTDTVYVGAFREQSTSDIRQNGDFEARQIDTHRVHPGYNSFTLANDVMVIKIDRPSSHPPVTLNSNSNKPESGDDLIVIGHGITDTSNQFATPSELHKVTVPLVSHDQCAADIDAIPDVILPAQLEVVEDIMLCAGFEEGGKDSCQGDSGGPLLEQYGNGYVQVGITSWGNGCAEANSPGVYTRVSAVKDWIDEQICLLSDNPPAECQERIEGKTAVLVDVTYDNYPRETGWSISQGGVVVESRAEGAMTQSGLKSERVYLDPGEYTFTMTDSAGDGTCCLYGNGNWKLFAEVEADDALLLAEGDGEFTVQTSATFVVPSPSSRGDMMPADETTQGPEATPSSPETTLDPGTTTDPETAPTTTRPETGAEATCKDSDTEKFLIDNSIGSQACSWLAENLDRFVYLCRFTDVALACPATCDICDQLG